MFGERIEDAANNLKNLLPEDDGRDWTVDAAILLALVYLVLRRVEEQGGVFRISNKLVVFPALERLWQELIHFRVRWRRDDITRRFWLSRTGRYHGDQLSDRSASRHYSNLIGEHKTGERDEGARPAKAAGPRRS